MAHLYSRDYDFNKFESTLPEHACEQVLVFCKKMFEKKISFYKWQQIFDKCLIFLLKGGLTLIFKRLEFPLPNNVLCQIRLELVQRLERRGKNLQTVGQIDGRHK